jgi:hypothetical protein
VLWGAGRVGPRGLLLLGVTGIIAVVLAVYGYGRGTVVAVSGPVGPASPVGAGGRPSPAPTRSSAPSAGASSSSGQRLGPLLSSTQYASYAYQVYPGKASRQARLATAGFDVSIQPTGSGSVTLSISASGSSQGAQTKTYPASDRVYFIEATFGDDSGNADYSYSDDGVIVTDAHGRIVK